jgi:hypothetical protein
VGGGIAVDAWGNAYVTGATQSGDFPLAHPLASNAMLRGHPNAFVSKLSFDPRSGTLRLAYSTYLGGRGGGAVFLGDGGRGIAVDAWGNAYVTGDTASADFPIVNPLASGATFGGGLFDAFVSKLSFDPRSGTLRLAYSTYLGGSGYEAGNGIAVDAWGSAYVTGITASADFPTAHPLASGATYLGNSTAFVSKLRFDERSGALRLAYSTYLGGRGNSAEGIYDAGNGIAVDPFGNAYVTGSTGSADFPTAHPLASGATFQGGFTDAFVAKIGTSGFEDREADEAGGADEGP